MRNLRANPLIWLAIALIVAIGLMEAFGFLSVMNTGGYYGMMGGGMGWGILFMGLPAIILIVVLIVAVGGLDKRTVRTPYPVGQSMHALEILDQRYARSEVSREDYTRIRTDLMRDRP